MKSALVFFALLGSAFSQAVPSAQAKPQALKLELRTSSRHVRMSDDITVSVLFRSPDRVTTMWNAFSWGVGSGFQLEVFDSSGREVEGSSVHMFFHPMPPDLTGKDALISIGGNEFAGFDSEFPVKDLFPRPGRYTVGCSYTAPLRRNYFQGRTIWGTEDGTVESPAITVVVDK